MRAGVTSATLPQAGARLHGLGPAALVGAELILIRVWSYGRYVAIGTPEGGERDSWLLLAHTATLFSLLLLVALVLGTAVDLRGVQPPRGRQFRRLATANLAVFGALMAAVALLPVGGAFGRVLSPGEAAAYLAAIGLFAAWQASAATLLFPAATLVRPSRRVAAFLAAAFGGYVFYRLQSDFNRSLVVDLVTQTIEGTTLDLSLFFFALSGLPTPSVMFDGRLPVIDTGGFAVIMAPQCAGYQGMLSATVLLGAFIALDWRRLRPDRALALVAIALPTVFVLNAARIGMLLYIGARVSPEVAVNGFHSHFGVVSQLAVVGAAMLALQLPAFRRRADGAGFAPQVSGFRAPPPALGAAGALMAPQAVLLAAGIVSGVFVGAFNWLYPAPILAAAAALWWRRRALAPELALTPKLHGLVAGAVVFVLWIAVIPPDPEREALLRETLTAAPWPIALAWLFFRVVGSSVVVPVVEELAFRGGLMRLIAALLPGRTDERLRIAVALLGSSVAFGLLHADVLAGTVAGVVYGLLCVRQRAVGDAVLAHAVTNFLIALYVLGFSQWSYW